MDYEQILSTMQASRFPLLREADPHPYGLPARGDGFLHAETWRDDRLLDVTLGFGDPLELDGPFVTVRTELAPGQEGLVGLDELVTAAAHQDEAVAARDVSRLDEVPDDLLPVSAGAEATVTVDGEARAVDVVVHEQYQAARCEAADGATVTITARHLPIDGLVVSRSESIEPALANYTEFFRRLAAVLAA